MAKFYTDIRQSKRLQEIGLSANTADLSLYCIDKDYKDYLNSGFTLKRNHIVNTKVFTATILHGACRSCLSCCLMPFRIFTLTKHGA